ncbi:hypothetical protein EV193_106358 [Herbihabitans rhizosphaerae]|uniref:Uncharacterized protein n=1 Tax=Herbihabitans rhizosphaerae TaxID=1872711 RepID=A0A4Q7KMH5_9PSEU|nr:hypothetical protein [Herbihabitans rhizosphaerae]RZS37120.1 hypothetical protein EV193_106358 [Herbihabitans rhizosphaerae]
MYGDDSPEVQALRAEYDRSLAVFNAKVDAITNEFEADVREAEQEQARRDAENEELRQYYEGLNAEKAAEKAGTKDAWGARPQVDVHYSFEGEELQDDTPTPPAGMVAPVPRKERRVEQVPEPALSADGHFLSFDPVDDESGRPTPEPARAPRQAARPQQRQAAPVDDDEDFSAQSWVE